LSYFHCTERGGNFSTPFAEEVLSNLANKKYFQPELRVHLDRLIGLPKFFWAPSVSTNPRIPAPSTGGSPPAPQSANRFGK
jgi:hypothetical protein